MRCIAGACLSRSRRCRGLPLDEKCVVSKYSLSLMRLFPIAMNDSVNTRFLKSRRWVSSRRGGWWVFTTASCLSSSCTYWNVCFILSSTSLSLFPLQILLENLLGLHQVRLFFQVVKKAHCHPLASYSDIYTPFCQRASAGLGPTLADSIGDCDKSATESVCARSPGSMPSSSSSLAEIRLDRLFLRVFRRIENACATTLEKPASSGHRAPTKARTSRTTAMHLAEAE